MGTRMCIEHETFDAFEKKKNPYVSFELLEREERYISVHIIAIN